ncbi:MAG: AAA family ATPase, partial [Dehalococcoidia bacterium]|nr:AAA family ATPase [Dehalococcoidia bacterium]
MGTRLEDHNTSHAPQRPARSKTKLPFLGRSTELQFLRAILSQAADGKGSTVFLTGQPGIGKTRLAQEVLDLAKERGFTILEGRSYSLQFGLAYAPLLNAFRPLLDSLDSARRATLVAGLPALGRLCGSLDLPTPEPLGDPALVKTRLFEAMLRFLGRLAKKAPVALFVDDLRWADPASLELFHYLACGMTGHPVLMVATYSTDGLTGYPQLLNLVGSLRRGGLAEEIVLPRLDPDTVASLVQSILDARAPADLLEILEFRAGGTPLFVEALMTALVDSGALIRSPSKSDDWLLDRKGAMALPPSVRLLILERLEGLLPDDRRVVDLIAIIGNGTLYNVLLPASGLEASAVLGSLRRLRTVGLVAEGMDGRDVVYNLTHSLIQEVACAELPEMERRAAHLAAIKALEQFRPDDLGRLARHYRDAGPETDPRGALSVLLAAGERARSLYANEEAAS